MVDVWSPDFAMSILIMVNIRNATFQTPKITIFSELARQPWIPAARMS
jgi:hypothetical protein